MEDLAALLDRCRAAAGATAAAVVGGDGLLIERSVAPAATGADLPLAGAEGTDLLAVADRLLMDALGAGEASDLHLAAPGGSVHLARLAGGAFTLLVLPPGGDAAGARDAVAALRDALEAALA